MELQIEKNIPIPSAKGYARNGVTAAFKKMEIGDSILLKNNDGLHQRAKNAGIAIRQRKCDGGTRVWRIA